MLCAAQVRKGQHASSANIAGFSSFLAVILHLAGTNSLASSDAVNKNCWVAENWPPVQGLVSDEVVVTPGAGYSLIAFAVLLDIVAGIMLCAFSRCCACVRVPSLPARVCVCLHLWCCVDHVVAELVCVPVCACVWVGVSPSLPLFESMPVCVQCFFTFGQQPVGIIQPGFDAGIELPVARAIAYNPQMGQPVMGQPVYGFPLPTAQQAYPYPVAQGYPYPMPAAAQAYPFPVPVSAPAYTFPLQNPEEDPKVVVSSM